MERQFTVNGKLLTIREAWLSGELGTTVWDAASVMLAYLDSEKESLVGKKVIELGSGTGVVGIGAALLGANVVLTDMPPLLDLMEDNARSNGLTPNQCRVSELTWGNNTSHLDPPYEIILLSDCITHSYCEHFPGLVKNLVELSDTNTRIIMAFERRLNSQDAEFFRLMKPHFTWWTVPDIARLDPYYKDSERLFIYEIRRRPSEDAQ